MMNGALELLSAECNSQHSLHGEEALGNPDASGAVQARRATDPFPRGRPGTRAGGAVTRVSRLCGLGRPDRLRRLLSLEACLEETPENLRGRAHVPLR